MKKFLLAIFVLAVCIYSSTFCFNQCNLLNISFNQKIKFVETYLKTKPLAESKDNIINVGFCYIAKTSKEQALQNNLGNKNIIGMAIELDASKESIDLIFEKLKFKLVSAQNIAGLKIFDGTSSLFRLQPQKGTNVQIAVGENFIKIGSPTIMGSF